MMNDIKPSNSQKLGSFVQDAMERMEKDFPEADLGDMMLICEFQYDGKTTTRTITSDARDIVQLGLLRAATLAAESR